MTLGGSRGPVRHEIHEILQAGHKVPAHRPQGRLDSSSWPSQAAQVLLVLPSPCPA